MTANAANPSARENILVRAWNWFFFQGYSGESLGSLRAILGAGLFLYHFTQFPHIVILDPFGAHSYFLEPIWYFDLLGIERHIPWLNIPVFLVILASTVFFMVGKWTKPAIIVMILSILYLKGVRDSFAGDVHHRYVIPITILVIFLFAKCSHYFSYDAKKYRNETLSEWEASWPIRAVQGYIILYYFWAVVAKLRVSGLDWFGPTGAIQAKLIQRSLRNGIDAAGEPVARAFSFHLAENVWLVFAIGILVALFELLAPVMLVLRKKLFIVIFLLGATCFHIVNFVLMSVKFFFYPVLFFSFFDMAWVAKRWGTNDKSLTAD